jgi:hypothetical protein
MVFDLYALAFGSAAVLVGLLGLFGARLWRRMRRRFSRQGARPFDWAEECPELSPEWRNHVRVLDRWSSQTYRRPTAI